MSAFRRVFAQDPGVATLLNVASINIIDNAPPATPLGAGTGCLLCVGEFERGPLQTPTELVTPADLTSVFGGFGWTVDGTPYSGPVAQQSGGNEAWNGNGYVALANKTYNRLVIQRVDNSAGSVEFTRLACLTGGAGPFAGDNGDTAVFELNGGPTTATATLACTSAQIIATGAAYPLVSPGGLTLILEWDDADAQTITLQDTDVLLTDVIARINGKTAAELASDDGGGQLQLDSVRQGSQARLRIVGGTALADLGLPTAVVADLWTITVTADTAITTELQINKYVDGVLTSYNTTPIVGAVGSIGAKRDALLAELVALGVPGHTFASSGGAAITCTGDPNELLVPVTGIVEVQGGAELTTVNTTPGVALEVYGTGNVGDSQNISAEEAANIIEAVANLGGHLDADGFLRVCNELTPGTGTIRGSSGNLLTAFGFDTTTVADAADATDVVIPAGTRVQDETGVATIWVTMEDIQTGTGGGPFEAKVRPFTDTDTAIASGSGDVTIVLDTLPDGFVVENSSTITRLTASQLDARYITAIRETNVDAPPANEVNYIVSARTSAAIRRELVFNARATTAGGLAGRKTIVRPRLGVSLTQAFADNAELRDERKQFAFPGFQIVLREILEVGAAGGIGFTDDGVISVGSDIFLASYRTILRPEQSAGELPTNTNYGPFQVVGLEETYDPGTPGSIKLDVNNYIAFKRNGIVAPKIDRDAGAGFVDDVTSSLDIARTKANRRAFADFINDSLLRIGMPFKGRMITPDLKRQFDGQIRVFLRELLSVAQPSASRIKGFDVVDITSPAVPELLRYRVAVTMYATADSITFETTVGPTVVTSQEVIAAA